VSDLFIINFKFYFMASKKVNWLEILKLVLTALAAGLGGSL
jgi:uncharacterized membrane protein